MQTQINKPQSTMGRILAGGLMIIIGIGVMLFLGKHSLNFFEWTFTGQDEIYSYLGLLLTSIGAVGWLLDFLYMANTPLRNTIALAMVLISLLGELGAAGFDMYKNAILQTTASLTQSDIKMMTIVVAGLGFIHGIALVLYVAGDYIGLAWKEGADQPIPVKDTVFEPAARTFEQNIPQIVENPLPFPTKAPTTEKPYAFHHGEPVTLEEAQDLVKQGYTDNTGKGLTKDEPTTARSPFQPE